MGTGSTNSEEDRLLTVALTLVVVHCPLVTEFNLLNFPGFTSLADLRLAKLTNLDLSRCRSLITLEGLQCHLLT